MDVIYHGPTCADGTFSVYLWSQLYQKLSKVSLQKLESVVFSLPSDLREVSVPPIEEISPIRKPTDQIEVKQPFSAHYIAAGKGWYKRLSPKINMLVVCDTHLGESPESIITLCSLYKVVLLIDHHSCPFQMTNLPLNLRFLTPPGAANTPCASKLCLELLTRFYPNFLVACCSPCLPSALTFVQSHDTHDEAYGKETKHFMMGYSWRYRDNMEPWRNLDQIDVENLLKKGQKLYKTYLTTLTNAIRQKTAFLPELNCLCIKDIDSEMRSDAATVLAALSASEGFSNLGIVANDSSTNKPDAEVHWNLRSSGFYPAPAALKISLLYGGGGHVLAAGCKVPKKAFKSLVRKRWMKAEHLTEQNIDQLMFHLPLKQSFKDETPSTAKAAE